MRFKLSNSDLAELSGADVPEFPRYTTQLMNLANQNSQGTRPKVVGQMSDLIEEFSGRSYEAWVTWYRDKKPDAIDRASERVWAMVQNLQDAIGAIDEEMVRQWLEDLVLTKTYTGLRMQQAILKEVAIRKGLELRQATAAEESQGIDGYIGEIPVSIKPDTYKTMATLQEDIGGSLIYYTKRKDGVSVECDL